MTQCLTNMPITVASGRQFIYIITLWLSDEISSYTCNVMINCARWWNYRHSSISMYGGSHWVIIHCLAVLWQVTWSLLLSYLRSCGTVFWPGIVAWYVLSVLSQASTNIWLSKWSNDRPDANGTVDAHLRDCRLGIYGALGALQGEEEMQWMVIGGLDNDVTVANMWEYMHNVISYGATRRLGFCNGFKRSWLYIESIAEMARMLLRCINIARWLVQVSPCWGSR